MKYIFSILSFTILMFESCFSQDLDLNGMSYILSSVKIYRANNYPIYFDVITESTQKVKYDDSNISNFILSLYKNAYYAPIGNAFYLPIFTQLCDKSDNVELECLSFRNFLYDILDSKGCKKKINLKTGEFVKISYVTISGLVTFQEKEHSLSNGLSTLDYPITKKMCIPVAIFSYSIPDSCSFAPL